MDANALHAQGLKFYDDGRVRDALDAFDRAHAEFLARGDEKSAAQVANDLAVAYIRAGRIEEARDKLEETIKSARRLNDLTLEAKATGNLAHLVERLGQKDNAAEGYRHAANLFHHAGEKQFEADTWRVLSQLELSRGRWLEALMAYDRALAAKNGSRALRAFLQIPLRIARIK